MVGEQTIIAEEPEQREPISTKQTPRYRNYIMSSPNKVAPHVNMLEPPVVEPIRERSVVKLDGAVPTVSTNEVRLYTFHTNSFVVTFNCM